MCVFSFIYVYGVYFNILNGQNEDFVILNFFQFKKILSEIIKYKIVKIY